MQRPARGEPAGEQLAAGGAGDGGDRGPGRGRGPCVAGGRGWGAAGAILDTVERVVQLRRVERRDGSYVARLLAQGDAGILKKVGEESAEVILAATTESPERLVAEVADLWFHTLVLLGAHGLSFRQVLAELARRHRPPERAEPRDP